MCITRTSTSLPKCVNLSLLKKYQINCYFNIIFVKKKFTCLPFRFSFFQSLLCFPSKFGLSAKLKGYNEKVNISKLHSVCCSVLSKIEFWLLSLNLFHKKLIWITKLPDTWMVSGVGLKPWLALSLPWKKSSRIFNLRNFKEFWGNIISSLSMW